MKNKKIKISRKEYEDKIQMIAAQIGTLGGG